MAQFYRWSMENFASIMSPIIKLLKKIEIFAWIKECQNTWRILKTSIYKPLFWLVKTWNLSFMFIHMHPN